jgi:RNA polymerase-associated protein
VSTSTSAFPHPPLTPLDPGARAQTRVALRRIEQDWYGMADILESSATADRRERERSRKMLTESVLAAEPLFKVRPWFLSDQFSQLDAAVAPILWRLPQWDIDLACARHRGAGDRALRDASLCTARGFGIA